MKLFNFHIITRNQKDLIIKTCFRCLKKDTLVKSGDTYTCQNCGFQVKEEELNILKSKGLFLDFNRGDIMNDLHLVFDHHFPYHTETIEETATYLVIQFLEIIKKESQIKQTPFFKLLQKRIAEYQNSYTQPNVFINHLDLDSVLSLTALADPEFALEYKDIFINISIGSDTGLINRKYKKYAYPIHNFITLFDPKKDKIQILFKEIKKRIKYPQNYKEDEFKPISRKIYYLLQKNILKKTDIYPYDKKSNIIIIPLNTKKIFKDELFYNMIATNHYIMTKYRDSQIILGIRQDNQILKYVNLNYFFIKRLDIKIQKQISEFFYQLFNDLLKLDKSLLNKEIDIEKDFLEQNQKINIYIKNILKKENRTLLLKQEEIFLKFQPEIIEIFSLINSEEKKEQKIELFQRILNQVNIRIINLIKEHKTENKLTLFNYLYLKNMLTRYLDSKDHYINEKLNLQIKQKLSSKKLKLVEKFFQISMFIDKEIKTTERKIKKISKYKTSYTYKSNLIGSKRDSNITLDIGMPLIKKFLNNLQNIIQK